MKIIGFCVDFFKYIHFRQAFLNEYYTNQKKHEFWNQFQNKEFG